MYSKSIYVGVWEMREIITNMKMSKRSFCVVLLHFVLLSGMISAQKSRNISKYNIVWDSQSLNSRGSMPVGGGNIQLNAWAEKNEILFYIGSTDSYLESASQIAKLGRVRLSFSPNPFKAVFQQKLDLEKSEILFTGENGFKMVLWVDVNQPVVHVEMNSGIKTAITATYETWKLDVEQQNDQVLFHHRNPSINEELAKFVALQRAESFQDQIPDPIKNLTVGGIMYAQGFVKGEAGEGTYMGTKFKSYAQISEKPTKLMDLTIVMRMAQDTSLEEWTKQLLLLKSTHKNTKKTDRKQSIAWWSSFWNRSYIDINPSLNPEKASSANVLTDTLSAAWQVGRNYHLVRYMLGCSKGAKFPVLFNGGIFNVDSRLGEPEKRTWQHCQYMAQNQRLVYWPMLKTGDFDLMDPVLNMYTGLLPIEQIRAKHYWNIEGTAYPEALSPYGLHSVMGATNPDMMEDAFKRIPSYPRKEWGHSGYVHLEHHYTSMLDFAYMFLESVRFGQGKLEECLAVIENAIKYYDNYYQKKSIALYGKPLNENGKLVIYPSSALELYGDAKNPTDVLAGLQAITKGLLALPDGSLTVEKKAYFNGFLSRTPEIKTVVKNGYTLLPPAETWTLEGKQNNMEFPQLYTLFPFETYTIGDPGLEIAKNTWLYDTKDNAQKNYICWFQGGIYTAHLGLTNEAKIFLLKKFLHPAYSANKDELQMRFPVFWDNKMFCHAPDMDQAGAAMVGLQDMLMQTPGNKIYLFPAWPKNWDVSFKLHAPYNTTVEAVLKDGKVVSLKVVPESRNADIVNLLKE